MAVSQLQMYQLTLPHREQAPSHSLISIHISLAVSEGWRQAARAAD